MSQTNRKTPHFELRMLKKGLCRFEVFATNQIGDSYRTKLDNTNSASIYFKSNDYSRGVGE